MRILKVQPRHLERTMLNTYRIHIAIRLLSCNVSKHNPTYLYCMFNVYRATALILSLLNWKEYWFSLKSQIMATKSKCVSTCHNVIMTINWYSKDPQPITTRQRQVGPGTTDSHNLQWVDQTQYLSIKLYHKTSHHAHIVISPYKQSRCGHIHHNVTPVPEPALSLTSVPTFHI